MKFSLRRSRRCVHGNVRFAQPNMVPEFAARDVLASNDALTIARELLSMTQAEFSATVVLGNMGTATYYSS